MVLIRHKTVSPVTDEHVAGEIGPDEWNEDHEVTGVLDSDVDGGDAASVYGGIGLVVDAGEA
jgi:hypothetical protein